MDNEDDLLVKKMNIEKKYIDEIEPLENGLGIIYKTNRDGYLKSQFFTTEE